MTDFALKKHIELNQHTIQQNPQQNAYYLTGASRKLRNVH